MNVAPSKLDLDALGAFTRSRTGRGTVCLVGQDASKGARKGAPKRTVTSQWATLDRCLRVHDETVHDENGSDESREGELCGLVRGGVHEWIGTDRSLDSADDHGSPWSLPLQLLTHLAGRAVDEALARGAAAHVIWIGRSAWPYPRVLEREFSVVESQGRVDAGSLEVRLQLGRTATIEANRALFDRSIFVAPRDLGERLWSIDTALRCASVTAVVADGSGLGMAATRRLQLAAQAADALVLLARPPHEVGEISAATTRWIVARDGEGLAWRVTLLRAKGAQVFHRSTAQTDLVRGHPSALGRAM